MTVTEESSWDFTDSLPGQPPIKVLIVDDEPGWRDLLTLNLRDLGYETATASNAAGALEMLRQHSFDLVITDVRMPGFMDGVDFIETYRRENPDQKVVFITGYAAEDKLDQVLRSKFSYCLKKPFLLGELTNVLSLALGR